MRWWWRGRREGGRKEVRKGGRECEREEGRERKRVKEGRNE